MASIRDVAERAGVSPATVSRAFASPTLLNEQTQRRVFEAAKVLNYRPPRLRSSRKEANAVAFSSQRSDAGLATGIANAIGFQFIAATSDPGDTLFANNFYAPVLAGAQSEAATLGLHLLVHSSNRRSWMNDMPRMVQEQTIGGMLVVGATDTAFLESLALRVPHIVLVDNRNDHGPFESVVSDGFRGAYDTTQYLIGLGHRRIAFFTSEPDASFLNRQRGFLCALFEMGIPISKDLIVGGALSDSEQYPLIRDWLQKENRPTAVVCVNDHSAMLALRACRELNLRVPQDISICGFDNIQFAPHMDPPLTTVHVDKEYMGRLAVRRLHAQMRGDVAGSVTEDGTPLPVCHEIPVQLIVRSSCAPPFDGK